MEGQIQERYCVDETWTCVACRRLDEKGAEQGCLGLRVQGSVDRNSGVWIFVAEKWIDKVVDVKIMNTHLVLVKMVMGESIVNIIS